MFFGAAPAVVLSLAMFFGAASAAFVFHERLSQTVVQWQTGANSCGQTLRLMGQSSMRAV
jgi:hypothetical protein